MARRFKKIPYLPFYWIDQKGIIKNQHGNRLTTTGLMTQKIRLMDYRLGIWVWEEVGVLVEHTWGKRPEDRPGEIIDGIEYKTIQGFDNGYLISKYGKVLNAVSLRPLKRRGDWIVTSRGGKAYRINVVKTAIEHFGVDAVNEAKEQNE